MQINGLLLKISKFYLLTKYAAIEDLLNKIKNLGVSKEVQDFLLSLPKQNLGYAANFVLNNSNATIEDVKQVLLNKQKKELLKETTKGEIKDQLRSIDPNMPDKLISYLTIQLRKYPDKFDFIKENYNKILNVLKEDVKIESYTIDELIAYINENFLLHQDQEIIKFLSEKLNEILKKINLLSDKELKIWAKKKAIESIKDWKKQINQEIKKSNLPFNDLLDEFYNIQDDIDNGVYANQDPPHSPLIYNDYVQLISNLEQLDRWIETQDISIEQMSISEVINLYKEWKKSKTLSKNKNGYNEIDNDNIVIGPNNWITKDFNGYFILELKDENDFNVEGTIQDHCVGHGEYWEKYKNGRSRIFSLRNVNNPYHPIITIETDSGVIIIRQEKGLRNTKASEKERQIIKEWFDIENGLLNLDEKEYSSKTLDVFKEMNNEDKLEYLLDADNVSKEIIDFACQDEDDNIASTALEHPNCSSQTLEFIIDNVGDNVTRLEAIAANPNINNKIVSKLLGTNKKNVIKKLLMNEKCPEFVLSKLSTLDISEYLEAIATNKNTPSNVLDTVYSKTNNMNVKRYLGINPNASSKLLENLSNEDSFGVLIGLASNRSINKDIQYKLYNKAYKEITNPRSETLLEFLSGNKSIDSEILNLIALNVQSIRILKNIINNPNVSKETLTYLSKYKYDENIAEEAKRKLVI